MHHRRFWAALLSVGGLAGCTALAGLDNDYVLVGGGITCQPGAEEACPYSGPPGTEGVGVCKAGSRTCAPSGDAYGECTGEVTPHSAEDCLTQQDDDCDGVVACDGVLSWSKALGYTGLEMASRIAADSEGNAILFGLYSGTTDVAGEQWMSVGSTENDLFVLKLGSGDGAVQWAKNFQGESSQYSTDVTTDSKGRIILLGYFNGDVDFGLGSGCTKLQGIELYDIFIARLTPDGNCDKTQIFGGPENQRTTGVTTDRDDNIIFTGYFEGKVSFNSGTLAHNSNGGNDIFLAKLTSDIGFKWSYSFGNGNGQRGNAVAADSEGRVTLVGSYRGDLNFSGPEALNGPLDAGEDGFAVQFDADGNFLWQKSFGGVGNQAVKDVATDQNNDIIIAGHFEGSTDLFDCPQPLTSSGGHDIFVAKLSAETGDCIWAARVDDEPDKDEFGASVAVDATGSITVMGCLDGGASCGSAEKIISEFSAGMVIAKFDANGQELWSKRFLDDEQATSGGIATASDGYVYGTAGFYSTLTSEDPQTSLTSNGQGDIFVIKLGP